VEDHTPVTPNSEQLVRELLTERRHERRKTYFKYGVLAVAALALFGGFFGSGSPSQGSEPYAAVVRVEGEILPGRPASAEGLNPQLEKAFSDTSAKAVILLVNSPGGTPVQASLVHDRIRALRAEHPNKPVIAVGEDMMTSGAYMIASAADRIVVNRSTVTGSIGVITRGFGFSGLMDKLGIERRVQTAGESKNMADPFMPQSEADRGKQAYLLARIHTHFIDTVKAGRGSRLKLDEPGLFSGAVWTGDEAVEMGLADSLGDLASVKKELGVKSLHDLTPSEPFLQSLLGGVSTKVVSELSARADVPLALPR
jgi:protease IV